MGDTGSAKIPGTDRSRIEAAGNGVRRRRWKKKERRVDLSENRRDDYEKLATRTWGEKRFRSLKHETTLRSFDFTWKRGKCQQYARTKRWRTMGKLFCYLRWPMCNLNIYQLKIWYSGAGNKLYFLLLQSNKQVIISFCGVNQFGKLMDRVLIHWRC